MSFNRYKNTKKKDGKYGKTDYPVITTSIDDVYVYSREGDRLDTLAYKYYKDTALWWIIAKANELPPDSVFIESAIRLRIPANYLDILRNIK